MRIILPLAVVALGALSGATNPPAVTSTPTITSASPTVSFLPKEVTVTGTDLGNVQQVTVAGSPAQILTQTPSQLVILPPRTVPGFMEIVAHAPGGSSTPTSVQMWPTLEVDAVGSTLNVTIDNGDDGEYILLMAFDRSYTTGFRVYNPYTEYSFWLDSSFKVLTSGYIPSPHPYQLQFHIPEGCHGQELYLQAWCRQKEFAWTFWSQSFTNWTAAWL